MYRLFPGFRPRRRAPDDIRFHYDRSNDFYGMFLDPRMQYSAAAVRARLDPDRLSFLHAVRVVQRKLPLYDAIPPSGPECVPSQHS